MGKYPQIKQVPYKSLLKSLCASYFVCLLNFLSASYTNSFFVGVKGLLYLLQCLYTSNPKTQHNAKIALGLGYEVNIGASKATREILTKVRGISFSFLGHSYDQPKSQHMHRKHTFHLPHIGKTVNWELTIHWRRVFAKFLRVLSMRRIYINT